MKFLILIAIVLSVFGAQASVLYDLSGKVLRIEGGTVALINTPKSKSPIRISLDDLSAEDKKRVVHAAPLNGLVHIKVPLPRPMRG